MKLTILGTGNALVTDCYNTCFVISDGDRHMMVDGGGGNGILTQLKKAGLNWMDMKHIFVTHKHLDHIMGIVWMVRMICQHMRSGKYEGDAYIYSHKEVIDLVRSMSLSLIRGKDVALLDDRLHLVEIEDGETREIIGHEVTFFDIGSTKAKQFGFTMNMGDESLDFDGKDGAKFVPASESYVNKLTCCGDEPFAECAFKYANGSKWMLHEAFCLYSERDIFNPYEKNHSTVKDACEVASRLNAGNVVLYHTVENNLNNRKSLYTAEGKEYYKGNIFVPDDLDVIEL